MKRVKFGIGKYNNWRVLMQFGTLVDQ